MNQSLYSRLFALVIVSFLLFVTSSNAQVITNGDFTGPSSTSYNGWAPPGWTTTIQSPDTWAAGPGPNGHNAPASPNGGTYVRTNSLGPEGIIQTVTGMTIGVPFTLEFWYAESCISLNPNAGGGRYNLIMFGVSQGPAFLPCTTPAVWYPGSVTFTPTSTSATLEIRTNYTPAHSHSLIDGVRLGTVLPIEDLELEVFPRTDRSVDVKWTTGKEINTWFFTVERSEDGQAWEWHQRVEAEGNEQVGHSYEYTDVNPHFGKSYYRLRGTDIDGHSYYSDVRTVDFGLPLPGQMIVYPNPTEDRITVLANPTELADMKVLDLLGKDQSAWVEIVPQNETRTEVDLSKLPKGIYLVKTATAAKRVRVD